MFVAIWLALLVAMPGCGGCGGDSSATSEKNEEEKLAEEREKERKKKPKKDFEIDPITPLPHVPVAKKTADSEEEKEDVPPPKDAGGLEGRWYKPGHWTGAVVPAKTNNFDFDGEMNIVSLDVKGDPEPLPGTQFRLTSSRDVMLSKGERKTLETSFFVPQGSYGAQLSVGLIASEGADSMPSRDLLRAMPAHQYHFIVLAASAGSYEVLRDCDTMAPPWGFFSGSNADRHYQVHAPNLQQDVPLPPHALLWTSIAYVLWDDISPETLGTDQQQALLDWLHWGGQLILSGPGTLEKLRDSFLEPYLPAVADGAWEISADDLEPFSRRWTPRLAAPLAPTRPWVGVRLIPHEQSRTVLSSDTAPLLVERRVGRGRMVVSAFRLNARELRAWEGFDGFLNGCLLRRARRTFRLGTEGELQVSWTDAPGERLDPRRICDLRYFTRDAGIEPETNGRNEPDLDDPDGRPAPGTGVAGWNDFNPVGDNARKSLSNAARIEIPDRSFVFRILVAYLVVLVPVNWAVFRVLRRVEWAWIAAPLIALAGTVAVIKMARLDIGFAQSRCDLAVVELQGDYRRAHVTRYSALYTSLRTAYDLHCDDPGAMVLPFPVVDDPAMLRDEDRAMLRLHRGEAVDLRGVVVDSNSTGFVHAEQMCDLGGPIGYAEPAAGRCRITNGTDLDLHGVGVLRRTESADMQIAWLLSLESGQIETASFAPVAEDAKDARWWRDQRGEATLTRAVPGSGDLNFGRWIDLAQAADTLRPGDVRLVAWTGSEIPGLQLDPEPPQFRRAALVVAHLRYGHLGPLRTDDNARCEVEESEVRKAGEVGSSD